MSKVLLLSEIFPPEPGGSGRWFYESYRRIQSPECLMAVGNHGNAHAFDEATNLEIKRLDLHMPFRGVASLSSLWQYGQRVKTVRKLARANNCKQIHAARPLFEGLVAKLVSMTSGIPYVCYVHGEDVSVAKTSRELTVLTNWTLGSAKTLIANSDFTRKMLENDWGIASDRIQTINPGVDTKYFQPSERSAKTRSQLGWDDRPVVLTVGRLQARKGQDTLIKALPKIVQQVPNVLYAIVGDGEQHDELVALTKQLQLTEHVVFHREISDALLLDCYQQCDLFCLPNRQIGADVEGFGMVLVEAQSCGKPVIAGDSGGTAETLEDGKTGFVVDCREPETVGELVAELLLDPERCTAMGQLGRERVSERFDWQVIADRSAKLFASIAD